MITIEELKRVSVDMVALNEYRSTVSYLEIVMFAISQHEDIKDLKNTLSEVENLAGAERGNICIRIIRMKDEIERLRAELADCKYRVKLYDYTLPSLGDGITKAQDEAYERAAQVCEAVSCYDNYDASETFAKAVRELKGLGSGSYGDIMQPSPGEPK